MSKTCFFVSSFLFLFFLGLLSGIALWAFRKKRKEKLWHALSLPIILCCNSMTILPFICIFSWMFRIFDPLQPVNGHIFVTYVSACEPVWPSGKAGKQGDLGSNPLRLSCHLKSCGLWTLSSDFVPHSYETLKWLSSLTTLMQKSFWWRQCSDRYIISLFLPTAILPLPSSPRA